MDWVDGTEEGVEDGETGVATGGVGATRMVLEVDSDLSTRGGVTKVD